ncbi:hypothetical protein KFL_007710030 [Klebsormidium nitens]|uniref:Uncharacterized protein n=1 Tax=Klebsormidium nitens TaxID=105231 RepID=A0A1Y1IKY1_KLENI|nr:hypothetical protein KFL_007710030 [Klebsormidium nitens]|eukprot:GAQ91353.1 hypothetical protein KFL_007710030 [Klebsormidium nitens]
MHYRKLAQPEDADGETMGLNEYLKSGKGNQSFCGIDWGTAARGPMQSDASRVAQHANPQIATALPRGPTQMTAILEQRAGEPPEQENVPPNSDALTLYLSKPRPHAKLRGLRKEGSGRVPQMKRTFGLDLRQLSRQQEGSDSEAEWEAGNEALARKKAERSAQRKRDAENRRRRQSAGGPRVSRGEGAEDMELDSDDDSMDLDRNAEMAGDPKQRQGEEEGGLARRAAVKLDAAWKTNPIFDNAWPEKQAAPGPQIVPPPAAVSPPKTKTAANPSPSQTPPPQISAAPHASLSAQAKKLAERILKERAAVSSRSTAVHMSEAVQVAEAGQVAEEVDFPALEGSPPRVNSVGSREEELVAGQMASGSAAEGEMREREEEMPEVMDGPAEDERPVEQATTSQAADAATAATQVPIGSRAVVRFAERKPVEKFRRLKTMLVKSRKSLASAGLTIDHGVRRSTRARQRPLEWWRNESFDWERSHDSLPTISKVVLLSPDPIWPRNDGRKSVKLQSIRAAAKRPALAITSG